MKKDYISYVQKSGYTLGFVSNLIVYGIIYKLFGIEWLVVFGIAHINTDQDWTNIFLFKNLKQNNLLKEKE